MTENKVFPKIRENISYNLIEEDGNKYAILFDPEEYITQPIYVPEPLLDLFQVFDGQTDHLQFEAEIRKQTSDEEFDFESFYEMVEFMDEIGFFETPKFEAIKAAIDAYKNSPVRPAVCAGNTYEADPEKLSLQLDELLSDPAENTDFVPSAVAVPHIDFRIGEPARKAYSAAYNTLKKSTADLFVIFGTSHYADNALFMPTSKSYSTPLGICPTDTELLEKLRAEPGFDFPDYDLAHRFEHSIELQVVLLQKIFKDRPIKILPVLCGSFYGYIGEGKKPADDEMFVKFVTTVRKVIDETGRNAVYMASGDFSHVGKRFEDQLPAEELLDGTRKLDGEYASMIAACAPDEFFGAVAHSLDVTKVCGTGPFYTMLKTAEPQTGKILDYGVWDDRETESAVTFASIGFGK